MTVLFEGETWDAPKGAVMFPGEPNETPKKTYHYRVGEIQVSTYRNGHAYVEDMRCCIQFECLMQDAFTWARDKNEMRRY